MGDSANRTPIDSEPKLSLVLDHLTKQEAKRLLETLEKIMTSLQTLTLAVTNLTTAVALIPAGTPSSTDPGMTSAQTLAAAATINAQTAILTADVAAPAAGVPAAPTGVLGVSNGGGSITLTFPPVAGATSYTVEQSLTTGAEVGPGVSVPAPAPTTPPSLVTYTVTGLTVGTSYFFEVLAVNAAGTSPLSAETTVVA